MAECIIYEERDEERDEFQLNLTDSDDEHSPSPQLFRNRAYHPNHPHQCHQLFPDIPLASEPYQTPIHIRQWISMYSEDEATPNPQTPNIILYNQRKSSNCIIQKSNTDSVSTVMPLLEVPPFYKLMNSFSERCADDEDTEMKDRDVSDDDEVDMVQLYECLRRMTDWNNHNDSAINVLLLTYPLVTNAVTILKCLVQRVFRDDHDTDGRISTTFTPSTTTTNTSTLTHASIPSFSNLSEITLQLLDSRSRSNEVAQKGAMLSSFLVQTKVIEFIRFWMDEYWKEDWQTNVELREHCTAFISRYKDDNEHEKINLKAHELMKAKTMAGILEKAMKAQKNGHFRKASAVLGDQIDCITPLSPRPSMLTFSKSTSNSKTLRRTTSKDILDVDSKHVAEQLTLIIFNVFRDIKGRECLDQRWKNEDKLITAPRITHYIKQYNAIVQWIQTTILFAKNVKHRCQTIRQWLRIQMHFHKLSNFMGVSMVGCALKSNEIYHLKDTWFLVEKKHNKLMKKHDEFSKLMQKRGNWKQLRELQRNTNTSIIPFFPMFATDMIAIEELNKKRVKNGTINFDTLCKIFDTINQHLDHQKRPYHIKPDATRQIWINKQLKVAAEYTEKQLYEIRQSVVIQEQKELGSKSKMHK
eukprot:279177_1